MHGAIPVPSKGQRPSAAWAAAVTDACNAVNIAGLGGTLARDGAGAFGSAPLPENKRDRKTLSRDMGCWKIVSDTREEESEGETVEKPVRVFANQYYLVGEVLHELALEDAVEDFVCQGELGEGEEYTAADKPFVALKVTATSNSTGEPALIGFKSLAELQTAQNDVAWVVKPLYKFTHDGAIAVDFRNCPALQVAEILP